MKKVMIILTIIGLTIINNKVFAEENWIENYGYYDFESEIKAKDYLKDINIPEVFEYHAPSNNPSGNKIEAGKPYIEFWTYRPEKYGSITGIKNSKKLDPDYIYLEDFYNSINAKQGKEINRLDNRINTNIIAIDNLYSVNDKQNQTLQNHENKLNDLNNRTNKLEETQYNIRGEIILQQGRKHKIGLYSKYNTNRHVCSEVGLTLTISLDDSYETKEINKLNAKLERLQNLLEVQNIETETIKEGNKTTIRIKQKDGIIKLMNKF